MYYKLGKNQALFEMLISVRDQDYPVSPGGQEGINGPLAAIAEKLSFILSIATVKFIMKCHRIKSRSDLSKSVQNKCLLG